MNYKTSSPILNRLNRESFNATRYLLFAIWMTLKKVIQKPFII